LGGLKYGITVTTYTKESSTAADRCEIEISYGDGAIDTISRVNGSPCNQGNCGKCGEDLGNDVKKNVYYTQHTYSGPGSFTISLDDPNRNDNVMNVPNSVNTSFRLETKLTISPFLASNSSVILTNPPIDNGCVGEIYTHNPGAFDIDNDSLVFSIIESKGENGSPIAGYVFPNEVLNCGNGTLTIDSKDGTLVWDSPNCQGEYNVAILIQEYKKGILIAEVMRDMQITIIAPCDNDPPVITAKDQLCVIAGDSIYEEIQATDINVGDYVDLTGTGKPLLLANHNATFTNVFGPSKVTSDFEWKTHCENVSKDDYQVIFKAKDDNPKVSLTDFHTMNIKIIAPAVKNVTATALGTKINLTWDKNECNNATCYKIYRKIDSLGFVPDSCETGVNPATGYQLIETLTGYNTTSYSDNNNGNGLVHGQQYCYLITACFDDGAESIASQEVCAELSKDVPIITHVTVFETDKTNGKDSVRWAKPTELDTTQFPSPYKYNIYRTDNLSGANQLIFSSQAKPSITQLDTFFIDSTINTLDNPYSYKIELTYLSDSIVGSSTEASSVYLSSAPKDKKVILTWNENTPWINSEYVVYKKDANDIFQILDTVSTQNYLDDTLVNGEEYCYYIQSIGSYSTTGIVNPIINNSQIRCETPIDNEAPCLPQKTELFGNCDSIETIFKWNNPNNDCADDVAGYNIYFSPFFDRGLEVIASKSSANDTIYISPKSQSIAGCYAVSVFDFAGNESELSDTVCLDNCPNYTLPDVFTPGNDGVNDLFVPFPYRFIAGAEISIFNRWGVKVFSTQNPDLLWDGKNQKTKEQCSDGTYYYVATVQEIRLIGIQSRTLTGFITLLNESKPSNTK
jgi:gliding motility-associated-like protein